MSTTKPFIFGGIASLTAEFGTFPIDTTKTRLQIQGQVSDEACRSVRYRGMLHALLRISREEGVQALYYGIAPALLRQASYGTIKIGLYHYFKQRMVLYTDRESLFTNILAGMSSGAIASCIANPTDVLKVRMQAASSETYRTKSNVFDSFRQIYHNEGWRGLYRGVGPTAQRAAMIAGVMLPSYDFFKQTLLDGGLMGDTISTHFLASFLAGIIGTLVTNPVDVVKSRMMNQMVLQKSSQQRHFYTSSWDCLLVTLRSEGLLALYKGFVPSYLRLGPWNIIFFITYEQLKSLPL